VDIKSHGKVDLASAKLLNHRRTAAFFDKNTLKPQSMRILCIVSPSAKLNTPDVKRMLLLPHNRFLFFNQLLFV
jgi:hypothetical protein